MDCSNYVKKCQKHTNQNINFLQIYPESADYKLACQRCLSVIQGKSYIYDLQEILSEESGILHYWPLSQSEKYFDEMLQILQILDTEEYQKQIQLKIKKLRTKFDDQIFKLENKLLECSSDKIKQEFQLKYKQTAQIKQLTEYIKEELNQQNQQENTKQEFKQFIKQQIDSNEIENLLKNLKENQQKQETNVNMLSQVTESIDKIFQDPIILKQTQDQTIKYNQELNELQAKVENLLTQLEEQKQKNEQEQIVKSEEIQELSQKINILNFQCDTNLKSSNSFQQKCEMLTQNFKQKEEDLNIQIQKYNDTIKLYENVKSKQSILHNHQLELTRFQEVSHTCKVCQYNKLKTSWYCSQCNFDVCQTCINKEEQLIFERANLYEQYKENGQMLQSFMNKQTKNFPQHQHQLNLISSSNSKIINCDICQNKDILFSWNCQQCDFDVCLSCSGLQKMFANHEHRLKLTHSHSQRYPLSLGNTRCDNCKSKNLQFSWHCFQCQYDLCLDCGSSSSLN
ncbi:hypothetical protein ABPG74_007701 [Tetrahymena malaccensis]